MDFSAILSFIGGPKRAKIAGLEVLFIDVWECFEVPHIEIIIKVAR